MTASALAWANTYNAGSIHAHTYDTYDTCTYGYIHIMTWAGRHTYRYMHIHAHTYTYMPLTISVGREF